MCRLLLLLLAVGVQSCRRHPVQKGLPDLLLVVAAALQARVSAAPRLPPCLVYTSAAAAEKEGVHSRGRLRLSINNYMKLALASEIDGV